MNLLLDMNVLLRLLSDGKRLSAKARDAITSAKSIAYSEVSLLEILVKVSIRKLQPIPKLYEVLYDLDLKRLTLRND